MNIIKRILAKTPKADKTKGKIATTIGVVCASVLATGLILNPVGIIALTVGSVLFGGKAAYHAVQVEDKKEEENPE